MLSVPYYEDAHNGQKILRGLPEWAMHMTILYSLGFLCGLIALHAWVPDPQDTGNSSSGKHWQEGATAWLMKCRGGWNQMTI
jgi:hypothetical protein